MWTNFWLQNIHFALEVFVGFASFVTAWLYIDAWGIKKEAKTFLRALGYFALALSFALDATSSEFFWLTTAEILVKLSGLFLLIVSFFLDPVPTLPKTRQPETPISPRPANSHIRKTKSQHLSTRSLNSKVRGLLGLPILEPTLGTVVVLIILSYQITVRATKGLIKEWRPLIFVFILFTIAELLTLGYGWENSSQIIISRLVERFGVIWITEHILKIAAFFILLRWSWGYIRFRLLPQLFIHYIAVIFIIFVSTTVGFTTLLMRNVERDQLTQLEVNVKTLDYALGELKDSAVLASKIAAENGTVRKALVNNDSEALFAVTNRLMLENDTDFFESLTLGGDVIMRAENRSRVGDNLSNDPVVVRALEKGKSVVSAARSEGITAPILSIRAVSPVFSDDGKMIGGVATGFIIDNAFVDKIKKLTGLDVTIFGNNIRSATTLFTPGTTSRDIGIAENDPKVLKEVINAAKTYKGSVEILNTPYYTAYAPLLSVDQKVIGMFSVGRPQFELMNVASRTIQLTFLISAVLMIIVILPVYFLTKYIVRYQQV